MDLGGGDDLVAVVHPRSAADEMRANTRLICAAPDLYAACKALVDTYESLPDGTIKTQLTPGHFFAARAALAKAEGRDVA